jgi:hypothetical protein
VLRAPMPRFSRAGFYDWQFVRASTTGEWRALTLTPEASATRGRVIVHPPVRHEVHPPPHGIAHGMVSPAARYPRRHGTGTSHRWKGCSRTAAGRQVMHEVFVDLVDAQWDEQSGTLTSRGSFATVEAALPSFKAQAPRASRSLQSPASAHHLGRISRQSQRKHSSASARMHPTFRAAQGITTLYLMGALERDNGTVSVAPVSFLRPWAPACARARSRAPLAFFLVRARTRAPTRMRFVRRCAHAGTHDAAHIRRTHARARNTQRACKIRGRQGPSYARPDESPFSVVNRAHPNEMLGGTKGFAALTEAASALGMRVIIDSMCAAALPLLRAPLRCACLRRAPDVLFQVPSERRARAQEVPRPPVRHDRQARAEGPRALTAAL